MNISEVGVGGNPPYEINVVIEIPMNSDPVKYEFDKKIGTIVVDRFLSTSMSYPCNYGFIPGTLSGDGDPADVLVYANYPIVSSAVIAAKPIGVLVTEDEKGKDEKILAVPVARLDQSFEGIDSISDLPEILIKKIGHFFERYKDLEKGKWVKVVGWEDAEKARTIINDSIKRYNENQ